MIPLVHGEDMEVMRQREADRMPVFERAKEAMQDEQWLALAVSLEIQLHGHQRGTERRKKRGNVKEGESDGVTGDAGRGYRLKVES